MRCVLVASCLSAAVTLLTTGAVAAQQTPTDPPSQASAVSRVLILTNAERNKAGLPPLVLSRDLQIAAQSYADVLASSGCFEHTCGPVPNLADRDALAGYAGWWSIGENLAGGYDTPESVMAGWMASPGHRANILSVTFTEIGVGLSNGSGQFHVYWDEEFGTRSSDATADEDTTN